MKRRDDACRMGVSISRAGGFMVALALATAWGQYAAAAPDNATDPVAASWASRAAIARGVSFLQTRAASDPDGWVVPPIRQRRAVGHTNVVMHFASRAVPSYEYETVDVTVSAPDAASPTGRAPKAATRRVAKGSLDPAGRSLLVMDPKGPIAREVRRPVYGPGGPDVWRFGQLGHNAMALYALRVAGVAEDDPVVQTLAWNLMNFVDAYGLSDATWDLAWLTASLARMSGDRASNAARLAAAKLLDGQVTEGDGQGLWGPVCINAPLLARALDREEDLMNRLARARRQQKESVDPKHAAALAAAEADLLRFRAEVGRIAMLGLEFDNVDYWQIGRQDGVMGEVVVCGIPSYIYNQTAVDIESTDLAIFGLREAAGAGLLGGASWRPGMGGVRNPPQAEGADAILGRCARALAAAQEADGRWSELNIHQPVTAFEKISRAIRGVPVDPGSFKPLPSPFTTLSTIEGCMAMLNVVDVVGIEKVSAHFGRELATGLSAARDVSRTLPGVSDQRDIGGLVPPYDADMRAASMCRVPGTVRIDSYPLQLSILRDVAARQQNDGSWLPLSKETSVPFFPTSMRARMAVLPVRDPNDQNSELDRSKAHVSANWWGSGTRVAHTADAVSLATSYAVIALSEGVRLPAVLCVWGADVQPMPLVETVIRSAATERGVALPYVSVDGDLSPGSLDGAPIVFLQGKGSFEPDESSRSGLQSYLMAGGVLIALSGTDRESRLFLDGVSKVVQQVLPQSKRKSERARKSDVARDESLLGELAGKLRRPLPAVLRADGSLASLELAVDEEGKRGLTTQQAMRLAEQVLRRSLDADMLEPAYAHALGDLGDADSLYKSAMAILNGQTKVEPPPAAEETAKDAAE